MSGPRSFPLSRRHALLSLATISGMILPGAIQADVAAYSNSTTYSNYSNPSGAVLPYLTDYVTPMQMDDLVVTPGAGGQTVTSVTFSAANSNTTAVTTFALVRFYKDDGANGGPGTLISSLSGTTTAIAPAAYARFTFNLPAANQFTLPLSGRVWAGVAFASGNGSTVTPTQLNNFAVACFNPPTVGTSTTSYFVSSDGGSYTTSNPSGVFKTGTAARGSFCWDVKVAALGPVNVTSTADTGDAGTLRFANSGTTAAIPVAFRLSSSPATITLTSAMALQVNPTQFQLPAGQDVTIASGTAASVISTVRGLSLTGPGTIRFTGANTYSGGTTLNGAVAAGIGNTKALGTGDITAASSSKIFATTAAQTPANDIVLSSGATLSVTDAPASPQALTLPGVVSGAGALEMKGTNLLTLSGANTFTGGLTLSSGTVAVSATNQLGAAAGAVNFTGGTLRVSGTALTSFGSRPLNATAFNGGLEISDAANVFTIGTPLSGAGKLTKSGPGKLVLTGANALATGMTLSDGQLTLTGSGAALGTTAPLEVNGGTFIVPAPGPFAIGALQGTGGTVRNDSVTGGSTTPLILSIGNGGASASYAGTISDAAGNYAMGLEKNGAGTQILNGTLSYTGPTRVKEGTLTLSTGLPGSSAIDVDAGAFLALSGAMLGSASNAPVITVNGTLQGSGTLRGSVVNNGTIRPTGGATLDASATTSFVNNGVVDLTDGNVLLPANFTNGPNGVVLMPAAPQITEISRNGDVVTIVLTGQTGHTYRLQKSATPDTAGFADTAAPAQTGTGAPLTFTDTSTTDAAFYRIRVD